MRAEPNTASQVITTIDASQIVQVVNHRSGWFSISYRNHTGWVYGRYISETAPKPVNSERPRAPSPPSAVVRVPSQNRSGQPVRQPYSGTCDCPYDYARNGSRCGGRSAYSRPGGRSPICYY
ncbi:SH3 domain-containing protein [Phyllobacterium sp. SB3]|uniref:SH3 domain-containing protein n=1 Tax=Phyllobacterium sp. SB3 TaxID=3156073 RepID=UPI0032AF451A